MNTNTATEYRNLPLAVLTESSTNPRRIFEDSALKELAASIRSQGVLSPLLVRPLTDQSFEIVAGARRYRATQMVEAPTVPVRIVNLSDAEALGAQLIENLQRSQLLNVQLNSLTATISLLDEGGTVPFIARYRKEVTRAFDEVKIRDIDVKENLCRKGFCLIHVLDNRSRKTRGKVDCARSEAADHGNAEAPFQLGHLYAVGQGLEHDYTESPLDSSGRSSRPRTGTTRTQAP
jgi:hypothetical protein